MKDKLTGGESHSWIELETEARLVALILGESSDFEESELSRLMEQWPEVRAVKGRFAAVDQLVREAVAPGKEAEWQLSPELRVRLLEAFELVGKVRNRPALVALPDPDSVPVPEPSPAPRRRREGKRWGLLRRVGPRGAVACLAMGLLVVVVFRPTIFERDEFEGRDFQRAAFVPRAVPGDLPDLDGFLADGEVPKEVAGEGNERRGVTAGLAALNATLGSATDGGWQGREERPGGGGLGESEESMPRIADLQSADPRRLELLPGDVVDVPQKNWMGGGGTVEGGRSGREESSAPAPAMVNDEVLMKYAAGLNLPDNGVSAQYAEYQSAIRELSATKAAGLGAGHPRVVARQAAVEELQKDLGAGVRNVRSILETQRDLVDARLEEMNSVVSRRRDHAVDRALESQDYAEAKREYENEQALLQAMKLQHSSTRVGLRMPEGALELDNDGEREKRTLSAIDAERRDQEDMVEEKRKVLQTIVQAVGIPYFEDLRGSGQMGRSEEEVFRIAQRQQYETEREREQLELQLKTLMRLSGEERAKYAAGLNLPGMTRPETGGRRKPARWAADDGAEVSAGLKPYSTFSLHVSDVSFKLAQAALEQGAWPEAERIRVEEFVNAFDYGDPLPSQRERVRCVVEQAAHPFLQQRNLVRVSMRTATLGRAAGTPLRLTVLLDHSGSMEREDRAESVRRAFALLAEQLTAQDQVTLISFARTPRLLADRVSGREADGLLDLVDSARIEGGTNLEAALRLGMEKAREQKLEGGQNRLILLTDGAANLGNARPGDLSTLVGELREAGIAFDACGVGADGLNDDILESLTRKGDGRYYFLDRPEDADAGFARQIAGALRPAAKNVKVQVHFNPARVGRYRLFGFEKHILKKEDFRNDKVDAAELAAEEAGNAVYQVEVRPEGEGEIGRVAVRFEDGATGRMVERTWVIPYEPRAPRLSEASRAMRLAGGAALFGEWLKGSAAGEAVVMKELGRMFGELRSEYAGSERVRALVAMSEKARGLRPRALE